MCADKNGDFHLVNYTYFLGVYHEQKTKDFYSRIQSYMILGRHWVYKSWKNQN